MNKLLGAIWPRKKNIVPDDVGTLIVESLFQEVKNKMQNWNIIFCLRKKHKQNDNSKTVNVPPLPTGN